jgi:hypothetical protein
MTKEWKLPESVCPIYVDLTKTDAHGNVPLTTLGTRRDLERHGIKLADGMQLYVYDIDENEGGERDDLFAFVNVHWDADLGHWSVQVPAGGVRRVSSGAMSMGERALP